MDETILSTETADKMILKNGATIKVFKNSGVFKEV